MKTKTENNNVVSEIIVISDDDESELLGFAKDESVIIIDNDDHELACDGKDTEDTEISDYTPAPQGRFYIPTSCAHSSKASKGLTDITTNDCKNRRKRKRAEKRKKHENKRLKSVSCPVSGQYQYPDSSFSMFNFSSQNNDEISTNTSNDYPICPDSHPVFFAYLLYISSRNSTFCGGWWNNQEETTNTYFLRAHVSKLAQKDNVADSQAFSNDGFHGFGSSLSSTSQGQCSNGPSTSGEGVTTTQSRRVICEDNNPSNSSTTTHVPQAAEYSSAAYDHSERESNSKYRVNCPVCQSHAQFTGQKQRLDFYNHIVATHLLPYYVCKKCNVEFQGRTGSYNCEIMHHYQRSNHKARCPWCKAGKKERSVHRLSSHCRKKHLLKIPKDKQSLCPHETCTKGIMGVDLVAHYLNVHERNQNLLMYFTCACGQRGLKAKSALGHYMNNHGAHFNEEMLDYLKRRFAFRPILNSKRLENISPSTVEQPCQPKDSKVTLVEDVRSKDAPNGVTTSHNVASASSSNGPETSTAAPTDTKELNTKELNTKELNLPCGPLENLSKFSHIIFIDLDNWDKFFDLPYPLPSDVFVWGFLGGTSESRKYRDSPKVQQLLREKRFFKHPKCGKGKNAADFALCVQAARLDLQLPIHIPFTVLSGDKGFNELTNQLASSARSVHLVDPHYKEPEILTAILKSIGEK